MMVSERDLRAEIAMLEDALTEHDDADLAARQRAMIAERQALLAKITGTGIGADLESAGDDVRVGRKAGSATSNQYGTYAVHAASEKQVNFLRKLIGEKDTTGLTIPTTLDGISKTAASALIDRLLGRPNKAIEVSLPGGSTINVPAYKVVSEKQVALIRKLATEKVLDEGLRNSVDSILENVEIAASRVASEVIDRLFAAPRKPVEVEAPLESGIYQAGEKIYKVYWNQGKTRMLAKLLTFDTATFDMQHGFSRNPDKPEWVYQGAADRFVKPEQRMTLEQAQAFGKIYGVCCNCGAMLTDETSIELGIGPVCRTKGHWA